MDRIESIIDYILNNFLNEKENINIIEIGTAFGDNSTKILYNLLKKRKTDNFTMMSYEGSNTFEKAYDLWKNTDNISIINEYFRY